MEKLRKEREFISKLYADFPNAMSDVYCGADYGKGWAEPIHEAVAVIDAAGGKVAQIKNKFDDLRLYYDLNDESRWAVWKRIACEMADRRAEMQCSKLCERCGGERVPTKSETRHQRVCTECGDTSY